MKTLFNNLIYSPLSEGLVFIYENFGLEDLGLSIIILTIIIRVILLPFFYKGAKNQTLMQKLQPDMEEIKKKHKDNKEEQAKALMALYKENKLNPFSSFLVLLIQLPIFFGLFRIFQDIEAINAFSSHIFLGINLAEPSILFAAIAAIFQYVQGRLSLSLTKSNNKNNSMQAKIGKNMVYFAPIISIVILVNLPSALALYWVFNALFSGVQQIIINKRLKK
ncbi:MAG: YidC/Oxa1 family membrane protein insertase [Candidatus Paceibacterota bacterium]